MVTQHPGCAGHRLLGVGRPVIAAVVANLETELAGKSLYFCGYLTLGRLVGPTLARAPLTLALFYGILALVIALPSLLLRLRPRLLRQG